MPSELKQTKLSTSTRNTGNSIRKRDAAKPMAPSTGRSYYLLTVSRDHVIDARSLGIVQACHGAKSQVQRMRQGDGIVFYSPRQQIKGKDMCQRFTGIATVENGEAYQHTTGENFKPWRRRAKFVESAKEVDVKAVLKDLECFKRGAPGWGHALRSGALKIGEEDWRTLWQAMVRPAEG